MRAFLATALASALLAGCGATELPIEPPPAAQAPAQRYEATGTVLEAGEHGPMLCLGAMLLSYPPQCGDVPIANWSWDAVGGEERAGGTVWGEYHLEGTYDGRSFTVIEVSAPVREPDVGGEIGTPCAEPAGGWKILDPSKAGEASFRAAERAARAEQDFAGLWVDFVSEFDPQATEDPQDRILIAAFTGDLRRHETELREYWGGPLCVTHHAHTQRDLSRIGRELTQKRLAELGLQMLGAATYEFENVFEVTVVAIDDETRALLEGRYGSALRIEAALQPAPSPRG